MRKLKMIGLVLLTISILPFSALAGDFDGSKPLLCAVIETFECGPGVECQGGTAECINIPQVLKISFKEKTINSTQESGPVRTTKIQNMEHIDGKLILQGVQNGKAWSMVISQATGKVTLSASDDQSGFLVFGACTTQ